MKLLLIICFIFFTNLTWAKYSLSFIVDAPPGTNQIFVSGNFNDWNPGDPNYKLAVLKDGRYRITISNLSPVTYRYKFTQGTWNTVESYGLGNNITNRFLNLNSDTTVYIKIKEWMQLLLNPSSGKGHTVRFIVSGAVENKEIYLAAPFTNWVPKDEKYKLKPLNVQQQQIILHHVTNTALEFKFTRGSWTTYQTTAEGLETKNNTVTINSDTTIYLKVDSWIDDYVDAWKYPDTTAIKILLTKAMYWFALNLDSAYHYASGGMGLAEKLNQKATLKSLLHVMAGVHSEKGNSYKAIELFYRCIGIAKEINDSVSVVNLYHSTGDDFLQQNDTAKAKECFYQAIKTIPKEKFLLPDKRLFVFPLLSLGRILLNEHKPDSAEYYVRQAINYDCGIPDWPLLLLGDIQRTKGQLHEALQCYRDALPMAVLLSNQSFFVAEAYFKMASVFYDGGQKDSSLFYARKAYNLASEIKTPYLTLTTGSLLVNLFKHNLQLDSAFIYQETVVQAKDSIFNKEKERQLQAVYYNEKIKQQELKAQNEKLQSQRKFYFLLAGLGLLLLVGLQYRSRLKTNFYKKTAAVEMKALRAQMNPHFIFNCLSSINRYVVKSDHKTASNYLTKFAKLIRLILDNSASEYTSLEAEVQTLKLYIEMELLRFDHAFEFEVMDDEELISGNISIPSMLIQPYVENAIWHGLLHKDDERKKLWIRFKKSRNHSLMIEVEDNGVGRQKAKELEGKNGFKKKSYGMQISKDRIELINKLYKYKTSVTVVDMKDQQGIATGTKVLLHIPLLKNNSHNNSIAFYDKGSVN